MQAGALPVLMAKGSLSKAHGPSCAGVLAAAATVADNRIVWKCCLRRGQPEPTRRLPDVGLSCLPGETAHESHSHPACAQ